MNARRDDGKSNGQRCQESGSRRASAGEGGLVGFAAVRLDGDGRGTEECIAPEDILFAFTQGAVRAPSEGRMSRAILAGWTKKLSFAPATVYLRTRSGIYRSYLRTLQEFKSKVPAALFDVVSKSVVANLPNVDLSSLGRQRTKELSYSVGESELAWPVETLVVGRAYVKWIRFRFGVPTRP